VELVPPSLPPPVQAASSIPLTMIASMVQIADLIDDRSEKPLMGIICLNALMGTLLKYYKSVTPLVLIGCSTNPNRIGGAGQYNPNSRPVIGIMYEYLSCPDYAANIVRKDIMDLVQCDLSPKSMVMWFYSNNQPVALKR
jgi:hypothetical protein